MIKVVVLNIQNLNIRPWHGNFDSDFPREETVFLPNSMARGFLFASALSPLSTVDKSRKTTKLHLTRRWALLFGYQPSSTMRMCGSSNLHYIGRHSISLTDLRLSYRWEARKWFHSRVYTWLFFPWDLEKYDGGKMCSPCTSPVLIRWW